MNDIKTIEELRVCHERLKEVVMALKRLEERDKESKGQAPHKPTFLIPDATSRKAVAPEVDDPRDNVVVAAQISIPRRGAA